MRLLTGWLLFVALAAGAAARFDKLADSRRFFLLREALQQPQSKGGDTLFYRGLVESRFGGEAKGIVTLTRFLAGQPSPARQRAAYQELADAFAREGRYRDASRNLTEALRLTPQDERADLANSLAVYSALADVAPQRVSFGAAVPVRATVNALGSWDVPVSVNGLPAQWIFDTGANWSTVSAGDAKRLGLETRESDAYVRGSTGAKNALRLAVADDVQVGRAHVKHVVFLVLSDESLFVPPLKYQMHGILGLPVLRALGRVGIAANGDVRIANGTTATGAPNLFFDGKTPIVEVRHNDRRMQMFLDTGANTSWLYRSFRPALTKDEVASLTTKDEQAGGAGGVIVRRTESVPALRLFVSGRPMDLADVSLLTTSPEGDARYRDGVLGADALRRGFMLDFRAMQLRLE